jgi:hypothetical protein
METPRIGGDGFGGFGAGGDAGVGERFAGRDRLGVGRAARIAAAAAVGAGKNFSTARIWGST